MFNIWHPFSHDFSYVFMIFTLFDVYFHTIFVVLIEVQLCSNSIVVLICCAHRPRPFGAAVKHFREIMGGPTSKGGDDSQGAKTKAPVKKEIGKKIVATPKLPGAAGIVPPRFEPSASSAHSGAPGGNDAGRGKRRGLAQRRQKPSSLRSAKHTGAARQNFVAQWTQKKTTTTTASRSSATKCATWIRNGIAATER